MLHSIVRDAFGQHYKIHTPRDPAVTASIKVETFWHHTSARQFLRRLVVPTGYWRKILNHYTTLPCANDVADLEVEIHISHLLVKGQLKVFAVKLPSFSESPPQNRTIKTSEGIAYRFADASSLLLGTPAATQSFASAKQAEQFIKKLNPELKQLQTISKDLGVEVSSNAYNNPEQLSAAIGQAMAAGEVIVIVDKTSSVPAEEKPVEEKSTVGNRKAELGTGGTAAATPAAAEEKPPCKLERISIQCSHGRSTVITAKTEATPSLAVIATQANEKGFDLITTEIHASELCSTHKSANFQISKEHSYKSREEKKVEFKVCCDEWNMSNLFERVWLPSVSPKTYGITTKDTCEHQDLKVFDVNVDVYPDMAWKWNTTIDFGKLEFVPGKAKVEYSDFDIDGNVVLTYDGKEHNAKEKYADYIQQPLDGFRRICDSVATVLEFINDPASALMRIGTNTNNPPPPEGADNKDGNETRLIVDWPKLTIDYNSKLVENDSQPFVDHDYSISIVAKPLLDIDIQVDVLDSMMSVAPMPVAELMRYAKKRIEEEFSEDQKVGLRGELDIIFTVKSTIDINESEIKGRHNVIEHDTSIEPVKGSIKIPAKLEGAVKAEGKWFVISFNVHYKMSGKTEWAGDFEFGSDETGIYFSNTVEFKGIDVTLTRYEEAKARIESSASQTDDLFKADGEISFEDEGVSTSIEAEDGKVTGTANFKTEEETRWSWLKPKEDDEKQSPKKHYIVKR